MKWVYLVIFSIAFAAFAQMQQQAMNSSQPSASVQALVIELSIPAPLTEVWKAFTMQEGLNSWLAPDTSVDLRPGGDWLVKFPGSTGGGTILNFIPEKELVISALAPDKFPHVRRARTHAVFTFTASGNATLASYPNWLADGQGMGRGI